MMLAMTQLFTPIQFRDLQIKNRIFVSPMCQYSAVDGVAQPWHLVHLGSRAVGGAGLVMAEATSVSAQGRISPADLGIWSELHADALKPVVDFLQSQGAVSAVQLAHAGRKAATAVPWEGKGALTLDHGGWPIVAPSAIAYHDGYQTPHEMSQADLEKIKSEFETACELSMRAGFQVIEIHMAHGYLLHEFLSPLTNTRTDQYGGSLENRMRFPLEIAESLRRIWPAHLPVFVRISATDWADGGWNAEESVVFCKALRKVGIDLIDVSTGGLVAHQKIEVKPLYQVPFAEKIRKEAQMATGAVGLITDPFDAEKILQQGQADVIIMAREFLRDPYWPLHAAKKLGASVKWPVQYERARP
jgi:2,4-dienoyl-CoA reductase-like NADH-dependent reductase (Old Yellow Enzyme family)